MNHTKGLLRPLLLFFALFHGTAVISAEYRGMLDGSPVVAELTFDGNAVSGSYHYQESPQNRKVLRGTNPQDGLIRLDEFIGTTLVARMTLTKTNVGSEIVWSGVRENQDGQSVIQFSRSTATAMPTPAASSAPASSTGAGATSPPPFVPGAPLSSQTAAALLGSPGSSDAHRFGRLYLGWEAHTPLPLEADLETAVKRLRAEGQPLWAAMRFVGTNVELQYESSAGIRFTLRGTNPSDGIINLTDDNGVAWDLVKRTTDQALIWAGRSRSNPSHSLFVYRPRHIIPPGDPVFPDEMDFVEPEAFLYSNHVATDASGFTQMRFPYQLEEESLDGTVAEVREGSGGVEELVVNLADGRQIRHVFAPPRPRNRVPVAVGYPITIDQGATGGEIAFARVSLFLLAWRRSGEHRFELSMVPTPFDDFQWDDLGNLHIPPAALARFPRVILEPDYAAINSDVAVDWHLWEDRIVWTVGDGDASLVELKGVVLDAGTPSSIPGANPAYQPGPWRPMTDPIDFPTSQLRTTNLNASHGYNYCLPGMD